MTRHPNVATAVVPRDEAKQSLLNTQETVTDSVITYTPETCADLQAAVEEGLKTADLTDVDIAIAGAQLEDGGAVSVEIVQNSADLYRFDAGRTLIAKCPEMTMTIEGQDIETKLSEVPVATVGDESLGQVMEQRVEDQRVFTYSITAIKGDDAVIVNHQSLTEPDVADLEDLANTVLERI